MAAYLYLLVDRLTSPLGSTSVTINAVERVMGYLGRVDPNALRLGQISTHWQTEPFGRRRLRQWVVWVRRRSIAYLFHRAKGESRCLDDGAKPGRYRIPFVYRRFT